MGIYRGDRCLVEYRLVHMTCTQGALQFIEINRSFEEIVHFIYAELQALIVK